METWRSQAFYTVAASGGSSKKTNGKIVFCFYQRTEQDLAI